MATAAELAAKFGLAIEEKPRYESEVVEPRKVVSVDKHVKIDEDGTESYTGAFDITWVDADGVVGRHTTTQYNPPEVKKGEIRVGGWLADGYKLMLLPSKYWSGK